MMTPQAAACFDRFQSAAFRLETLQTYVVDAERDDIDAWRAGRPRPEYSIRTSPWLARIAADTLAGKQWSRVRLVDLPASDYLRWQLLSYVEGAAIGEQIRLAVRADHPGLADLTEDFWLFDQDTADPFAIAMTFDAAGRPGTHQLVTDPHRIARYIDIRDTSWDLSLTLNEFLAAYAGPLPLTA